MDKADKLVAKTTEAWEQAALDLGLEIEMPFCLDTDTGQIKFMLLIKYFGKPKGTLIQALNGGFDMDNRDIPQKYGYYCSFINPVHYKHYDRATFIETLTDWGFFGQPENKPIWYNK